MIEDIDYHTPAIFGWLRDYTDLGVDYVLGWPNLTGKHNKWVASKVKVLLRTSTHPGIEPRMVIHIQLRESIFHNPVDIIAEIKDHDNGIISRLSEVNEFERSDDFQIDNMRELIRAISRIMGRATK